MRTSLGGTSGRAGRAPHAPAATLRDLMNVGPATEADLRLLGITRPGMLVGKDPLSLYARLCRLRRARLDPCCLDVLMAVVDQASGGPGRPWWKYTARRKAILASGERSTRGERRRPRPA